MEEKDSRGKHQSSLLELDSYLIRQSSIPSTREHQRAIYREFGSLIVDLHLRRSRCLRVSSILLFGLTIGAVISVMGGTDRVVMADSR